MPRLIAVYGKSCSGKDTLLRRIRDELDLHVIVACTTRPIRATEVNGSNYHFYTVPDDTWLLKQQFVVANGDTWFYGVDKSTVSDFKTNVGIFHPSQKDELDCLFGNNVLHVYLDVPDDVLLFRGFRRGDDIRELERRFYADRNDFKHVTENLYKYVTSESDALSVINQFLNTEANHLLKR